MTNAKLVSYVVDEFRDKYHLVREQDKTGHILDSIKHLYELEASRNGTYIQMTKGQNGNKLLDTAKTLELITEGNFSRMDLTTKGLEVVNDYARMTGNSPIHRPYTN